VAGAVPLALALLGCHAPQDGLGAAAPTRIERSGRLALGYALRPDPGDGALVIDTDGVVVELTGELRGAPEGEAPDGYAGVGIRITGKGVTLRGARVSGYKVGIHAAGADGLVLEDCDVSGNFRQRLASTPEKEAGEDWLDPHHNDDHEWFTRYGAGIYVERANDVVVRGCRARAGQNGLVLDRCERAQVLDNDFSFLSGWGIALWRSSDNRILNNACDFCIRGYSHGVYNRGQDSAGILVFEQCSRNWFGGNSATHCGDGFFCFAGQEALGGVAPPSADFDHTGKGCNENWIVGNDFSYAAAHGLELTFSFDNVIKRNRMVGNAICGIWGGYSRRTLVQDNDFAENGDAGYGLERGGVNIEHGLENEIVGNRFRANACGVHLWWDEDAHLVSLPWAKANGDGSEAVVADNSFDGDRVGIQLRGPTTMRGQNRFDDVPERLEVGTGAQVLDRGLPRAVTPATTRLETTPLRPRTVPVGARADLAGRERIRMDAWGPVEAP